MPEFCDVALPVPLDMVFTYRVPADAAPVVGGRVLVPFRQQRMTGIVVELHDRKPIGRNENVLSVLDDAPGARRATAASRPLDCRLLSRPARRSLPHHAAAERGVQTRHRYRITAEGQMALHLAGMSGSSARSRRTPEEQAAEFRVLDYLSLRKAPAARRDHAGPRRNSAFRHTRFQVRS
jgi:primosomal protein N' (replication factor Y) (superfamily II helicase)